jgi:hypothetical protein
MCMCMCLVHVLLLAEPGAVHVVQSLVQGVSFRQHSTLDRPKGTSRMQRCLADIMGSPIRSKARFKSGARFGNQVCLWLTGWALRLYDMYGGATACTAAAKCNLCLFVQEHLSLSIKEHSSLSGLGVVHVHGIGCCLVCAVLCAVLHLCIC